MSSEAAQERARRRALVGQQREQAFNLRVAGVSYRDIAKVLGVSTTAAFKYVKHVVQEQAKLTVEKAEHYREIELQRSEQVIRALWPKRGDPRAAMAIAAQQKLRSEWLGLAQPVRVQPVLPAQQEQAVDLSSLTNDELRALRDIDAKLRQRALPAGEQVVVAEVVVVGKPNGAPSNGHAKE